MFGYVTVYKELTGEADYEVFRSYYCGLCKAIGSRCSHASRLGLSYDITFLALVLSAVSDDECADRESGCMLHPIKKRRCIYESRAVGYAADMGVILDYLKLLDDWHDERSIKALFGMLLLRRGMKKAKKRHAETGDRITGQLERLSTLEKEKCGNIDECADCFAKILELLFTPDFIGDEASRRTLAWFGYNIGRWIYVIDALNDMEKDYKSGSYNAFNEKFAGGDFQEYAAGLRHEKELTLTFTLENAASALDLLDLKRCGELIRKIVYDCLKASQYRILYSGESSPEPKGKKNEPI